MQYIFPAELLKKEGKEARLGMSSGSEPKKKYALLQSKSEKDK
jgi:hypothetical protein